ncbi:type II toxin-antitoxin system VapC family toxin [Novosphingobium sp. FKTRR1]|uniref:type II toxin-antitoxin system VapC family toxin n=1 Tax=Novosphingobium sp. FKTRR1 TaxID=2879118 RepID=UPI001CEFBE95|nr:type II toxin-antitoxin system VapC family toxin [Novosphingobium sp. FKTRR1]
MIYLIDSNVVSELMRPAPSDKVVTWLDRHAGNCALPTIAIYEVRAGINTIPPGRRRDELMGAFERIVARFGPRVVSFDRSSAEMAAELAGVSASAGRTMTTGDVQIAGIAGAYGLTLVTWNVKDFAATGIDLVNPWGD